MMLNNVIGKLRKILWDASMRCLYFFDLRPVEVLVAEILKVEGNFTGKTILDVMIKYDYGDATRGLSYEHYNFYGTLVNAGYRVVYFPYDELAQKYGKKKMSLMLREAAYYYQPEILLYNHFADWVDLKVWKEISEELPAKTVIFLGDDDLRYEETRHVWKLFNVMVVMDPPPYKKKKAEGFNNVLLSQFGVNQFLYKNLDLKKIYDVVFIGQSYGKRPELIAELKKQGIDVHVFGKGWPGAKRISQSDVVKIYNQSKIAFNSYLTYKDTTRINARDFEASACGALCVSQDVPEIRECFEAGKEIILYKNIQEAAEKIKYYLAHEQERQQIARAGYQKTLAKHTYQERLKEIIAFAEQVKK